MPVASTRSASRLPKPGNVATRRAVELIWVLSLRNCRSPNSLKVYSKTSERLSNAIGVHRMCKFIYLVVHETFNLIHRYGLTCHCLGMAPAQNCFQCFVSFHITAVFMITCAKVGILLGLAKKTPNYLSVMSQVRNVSVCQRSTSRMQWSLLQLLRRG